MTNFTRILSILALGAILAPLGFSQQATLNQSTLASAITDGKSQFINVTSATGIVANTTSIWVADASGNGELMVVTAVTGTSVKVQRGAGGTAAPAGGHLSGAVIFSGLSQYFGYAFNPQGACTRASVVVVPRINVKTGQISDCLGGTWVTGNTTSFPRFRVQSPDPGGTAYTAINTNGTTLGATTVYCTEVNLGYNKLLTGIAVLNGTTVGTGTDKAYVVLYDASGVALANSALAGTASANASTYQERAFTSKLYAVGPAQYFACLQTNSTTDTIRMAITGINANILTAGQTGATYGTVPALTVPTGFTTAVGPYVYLY